MLKDARCISISVPREYWRRLRQDAAAEDISVSALLRGLIEEYFAANEPKAEEKPQAVAG